MGETNKLKLQLSNIFNPWRAGFVGGRGLDHQVWDQVVSDLDDIQGLLNQSQAQNYSSRLDTVEFSYSSEVSSLSSGFLVVPKNGSYSFMMSGRNCQARLLLSPNKFPENKVSCTLCRCSYSSDSNEACLALPNLTTKNGCLTAGYL